MKIAGIYQIINLNNGKRYVGRSRCMISRWKNHESDLNHNKHGNIHLQRAFNLGNDFEFQILLICDEDVLQMYEQMLLDKYVRWGCDYNISESAEATCGEDHYNYGKHLSNETKQKISKALIRNHPFRGKRLSEEARLNMSINHADVSGKNNPMYGVRRLDMEGDNNPAKREEVRRKISEAMIGNNNRLGGKRNV